MEKWELIAESWSDLHDQLFADSWDARIGRFRSPFVFRGLDDADYALTTTLARLGPEARNLEPHLNRNFRKYAPHALSMQDSDWHLITLGQHHGLPTRVLDWSISPQVAMHFATWKHEHMNKAGAVWAVDVVSVMSLAPDDYNDVWHSAGGLGLGLAQLAKLAPTMSRFEDAGAESPFAIFYEPPSIDDRIVNQFAMLSALSDPGLAMDEWLKSVAPAARFMKVIIPSKLKWEVRDKLDHLNVTERVLFPGLDGICQWLHRYYRANPNRQDSSAGKP